MVCKREQFAFARMLNIPERYAINVQTATGNTEHRHVMQHWDVSTENKWEIYANVTEMLVVHCAILVKKGMVSTGHRHAMRI